MDTKQITIGLLAALGSMGIFSTCTKGLWQDCSKASYVFETELQLLNDAETVSVKDTLWIIFTCPTTLQDINTGDMIDYSNAKNMGTAIDFIRLLDGDLYNPAFEPVADSFHYEVVTGKFLYDPHLPERNRDYAFTEIGNTYNFKLGIIPQDTGTFMLSISDAANVFRRQDPCTKADFQIRFARTSQHLDIFRQKRPGYELSYYEMTHLYCFKVK